MSLLATVLSQPLAAASCKMVLAYYADWNKPAYSAANIPFSKLTHICHAFIIPNADGSLSADSGYLEPALNSGAHAAGVKVLISVGGANGSGNFSNIAANQRQPFANAVRDYLTAHAYDGVDIDWEFPSNSTDRSNYNLLMQALRSTFNAAGHPEWLISGAFSSDPYQIPLYDLATLKNSVSFFNVMTYDYHGPWSSHMGHNAPLFPATGDPDANLSSQNSINLYLSAGVPASQLVFGLPFYGYNFPVEDINNTCPGGNCGGASYVGYLAAAADVGNGWTRYWDASAQSCYLRNNTTANTITYDDPQSIQAKSAWALNTANLGGVFMWELSGDYTAPANQPLLDAMRAPLACGPTATPTLTPTPIVFPIQGRIQAEDYAASYDTTAGNAGGAYRTGDTDIEATTDVGGGYDVGYTDVGEWLDFKVLVGAAGSYDFTFRVASANTTAMNLSMQWDGAALGGTVAIPGTGGWQTWADVKLTGVALGAGAHTLRVLLGTGGYNLNYIDVYPTPLPSPTMTSTRTRTPIPSSTRSATLSSTPTQTPSPDPSGTATVSATASASRTGSATPTRTLTAQPTGTPTATVTRSTTAMSSATATSSATAWVSATSSASATPSPVGSPSSSATQTSRATVSFSASVTPPLSSTASMTVTQTPNTSASPSSSPTFSASVTATLTLTLSGTETPSASVSRTPDPSATQTIPAEPSATATVTSTRTRTATPWATPSPTLDPTPDPTAQPTQPGHGSLVIQRALPVPNPDPTIFYVQLSGWADSIDLGIYSSASTLIAAQSSGPHYPGWTIVALPASFLSGAKNGTYFYTLQAKRGGVISSVYRGTLLILR